jgi:hypothetical protein
MYFFSSISFVYKNKWEKYWTFNLWVERKILTTTSHVFNLKLLCKKNIYNINHYVGIVQNLIFFHVGHYIINALNLVPHLIRYHCLMFIGRMQIEILTRSLIDLSLTWNIVMIVTLHKDNVVVIKTLKKDMLLDNFHTMEVIIIS